MKDAKDAAGEDKKLMKEKQEEEGINIAVDLIQQCRRIEGVKGVHIQAIEWESAIPEIVKRSKLFPRPELS
jgi:methylenetetrahydrofolate reductase (NADPH)